MHKKLPIFPFYMANGRIKIHGNGYFLLAYLLDCMRGTVQWMGQ